MDLAVRASRKNVVNPVVLALSAVLALVPASCGAQPAPTAHASAEGVKPPPYSRAAFGDGWRKTNRWCDVRDTILARDLTATTTSHGCNVLAGTLRDPYTGIVVVGSTRALDIDHIAPLEYLWVHGAWRWTPAKRQQVANDPQNLQTTIASVNRSKGSDDLGEWLPPQDPCGYARRFDTVADRYGATDPARDGEVARACR